MKSRIYAAPAVKGLIFGQRQNGGPTSKRRLCLFTHVQWFDPSLKHMRHTDGKAGK